jgi:signal transduction histidine kinase/ligand-binding sensor domain-containing protein
LNIARRLIASYHPATSRSTLSQIPKTKTLSTMRLFVLGQIKSKCLPRIWRWPAMFLGMWLASSLFPAEAWAQYRFDHWMTEQGLPQNSVLAITQTRDGYLWLATYNGLVRFDGVRFTVFDNNNTQAFRTSRIPDLYEDPSGALWISTVMGGVLRYQNGIFMVFTRQQGLPHDNIIAVQSGPDGTPLIFTEAGAVWWRAGRFVPYEVQGSFEELWVHLGRSGTHWLADKRGVHARRDGQNKTFALPVELNALPLAKMYEDRSGALWVAPQRHGVFRIKDGVVTDYTHQLKLNSTATVFRMLEDQDGSLWFGTLDAGLVHFQDDTDEATVYTTANGLSSNAIRGLCQDREGTLWIGTDGGGLNRMARQFISGYSEAQGLNGNVVHGVMEDRAGNVWAATQTGLGKIAQGVVTNYAPGKGPSALPLRGLQVLHEDRVGRLWVGGWDGLCFFKDNIFSAVTPNLNVHAIHEDRQGVLWVGTHYGLVKFKDGVQASYTNKDGLPNDIIRVIHEDRHGALWLGTEGGLVKFQDGRFTVFTIKDGLVNDRVWAIHEDAEGMLWLGTFDGGLSRYKDGRFTSYTTAQGLYNNGVFQILEDGRGYLWMSCYRGLYRVSKHQLNAYAEGKIPAVTSTAYGKAEGMLSADCNGGRQPSGVKTRDGKLWFATLLGVAIVNPDEMPINPLPPPVLIESARLDRNPVKLGAEIQGGLRIQPGQNNLAINYTALSFLKPEQIRFKYQLLGQDSDWIEAGTQRTANYSYLRPGQYTFRVIAANSDGIWNEAGAQLSIVVLPAFYQTWWFRLLALLAVAGSIGWVFKRRLDQAHRARRAQEEFSRRLIDSQEQERKRIAAELHDSLGQNLLVIKNYALMALNTGNGENPMREHVVEISDAATLSIEEVRQIAHNLRPYQLERLGLTNTLQTMLRQIANASDIGFTVEVDNIDGLLTKDEEISLYRIVQEAVNNILKHSGASEADIHIKRTDDEIQLTITDNGRGFTLEPAGQAELQKRGFGLTGSAERVRMLGGTQTIQTAHGQGTTIHITIKTNKLARNQPTLG